MIATLLGWQLSWQQLEFCFLIGYRPYAYDIIITLGPHLEDIGLRVIAVVSDVPAADHKRVQGNGFVPQHGSAMSVHKICNIGSCYTTSVTVLATFYEIWPRLPTEMI